MGIITTKEIQLINILSLHKNVNCLRINQEHKLIKFDGEINKNSNLVNLLENFNAPNEFMKFIKKRKVLNEKNKEQKPDEENKYLIRLKECLKECFLLEISGLRPEEKLKIKSEIIKKYFK